MKNKNLLLVLSDKGGTGKSLFCRGLADYLQRKHILDHTLLVDGDGEVGQLLQFYQAFGVVSAQITDQDKRDDFINILESDKQLIVVDLPAASLANIAALESEIGFLDLVESHGYQLTLCNVISPFKASIRSVKTMVEWAGEQANYVVVKNRFFGMDEEFHLYKNGHGKKAIHKSNGIEIELPMIASGVLAAIDVLNLPFFQAVDSHDLKLAYRCRINKWLQAFDLELDQLPLFKEYTYESASISTTP